VITALGLDGVRAPFASPRGTNAVAFQAYVGQVLVPALRAGDVVVFNNLASHLRPEVTAAIERIGARVLPLPPFSPDFNPIEEMFSKLKEALRRLGAGTKDHLYDAIGEALGEVALGDIVGWFRHAGSCPMQA
jgi:transposase